MSKYSFLNFPDPQFKQRYHKTAISQVTHARFATDYQCKDHDLHALQHEGLSFKTVLCTFLRKVMLKGKIKAGNSLLNLINYNLIE